MRLLPRRKILIKTAYSRQETIERIKSIRPESENTFLDEAVDHFIFPFKGALDPDVEIEMKDSAGELELKITMKMHYVGWIVFGLLFSILGYWDIQAWKDYLLHRDYAGYPLMPLALLILAYILMLMYFNFGADQFERRFRKILARKK